jgi:hypothetical protein
MKIAVCLSGQPRYFEQGCSYFKKSFSGLDVDYFIHNWAWGILFCGHRLAFHHMNLLGKPFKQILNPQGRAWAWLRQGGLRTF